MVLHVHVDGSSPVALPPVHVYAVEGAAPAWEAAPKLKCAAPVWERAAPATAVPNRPVAATASDATTIDAPSKKRDLICLPLCLLFSRLSVEPPQWRLSRDRRSGILPS